MENFLLIVDELDDALFAFRLKLPGIFGFLGALAAFAATVLLVMNWPIWTIGPLLVFALARGLSGLRPTPGLRTDP